MRDKEVIIQYSLWNYHNLKLVFPNIYVDKFGGSEVDALYISKSGYSTFYEIKCSYYDFRKDFKKPRHNYLLNKDSSKFIIKPKYFTYVCYGFKPEIEEIPKYAGCILVNNKYKLLNSPKLKDSPILFKEKIDENGWEFLNKKIRYRFLDFAYEYGRKEYWKGRK